MLGQHPDLYAFPELNLFLTDTFAELLDWDDRPATARQYLGGLTRAIAELEFGGQDGERIECARDWLKTHREWQPHKIFRFLTARIAPKALVDKSPRTSMARTSCLRALAIVPDGRFIHLTRHPAASISSFCSTVPEKGSHVNRAFAQIWISCQQSILNLTETLKPAQTFLVHGEDIIRKPDETLGSVLDWLKLPSGVDIIELMKHPEMSPFAFSIPGLGASDNDAEFLTSPRLKQPAPEPDLETVSNLDLGKSLTEQVVGLARRLGYSACN